jgi:hypothetical protein
MANINEIIEFFEAEAGHCQKWAMDRAAAEDFEGAGYFQAKAKVFLQAVAQCKVVPRWQVVAKVACNALNRTPIERGTTDAVIELLAYLQQVEG